MITVVSNDKHKHLSNYYYYYFWYDALFGSLDCDCTHDHTKKKSKKVPS